MNEWNCVNDWLSYIFVICSVICDLWWLNMQRTRLPEQPIRLLVFTAEIKLIWLTIDDYIQFTMKVQSQLVLDVTGLK